MMKSHEISAPIRNESQQDIKSHTVHLLCLIPHLCPDVLASMHQGDTVPEDALLLLFVQVNACHDERSTRSWSLLPR